MNGKDIFDLMESANVSKRALNHFKIELGLTLDKLQSIAEDAELKGIEIDTFNQMLANLHLNKRRVLGMIRNARYIEDLDIPSECWCSLDSSVIELFRKKNINPMDYWDDILTLSYSDLEKITD